MDGRLNEIFLHLARMQMTTVMNFLTFSFLPFPLLVLTQVRQLP